MAKTGSPWSVKGIDEETREIARAEAHNAGMTIGHWVNQVILETALHEVGAAVPGGLQRSLAASDVATSPKVPDFDPLDAQIAVSEQKIELAISPLVTSLRGLLQRVENVKTHKPRPRLYRGHLKPALTGANRDLGTVTGRQQRLLREQPWSWQLPLHPAWQRVAGYHWSAWPQIRWVKPSSKPKHAAPEDLLRGRSGDLPEDVLEDILEEALEDLFVGEAEFAEDAATATRQERPTRRPSGPQTIEPPAPIAPVGDLGPVGIFIDVHDQPPRPEPPLHDLSPTHIIVDLPETATPRRPVAPTLASEVLSPDLSLPKAPISEALAIARDIEQQIATPDIPLVESRRRRSWPIIIVILMILAGATATAAYLRPQSLEALWLLTKQQAIAWLADTPVLPPAAEQESLAVSPLTDKLPEVEAIERPPLVPQPAAKDLTATDPVGGERADQPASAQVRQPQATPPAPPITSSPQGRDQANAPVMTAVETLRQQAQAGNSQAQSDLGLRYLRAEGVARDAVIAAEWLREAAIQGEAIAQYNLAVQYLQGDGISANTVRAQLWFLSAAEQGFVPAMYNLGLVYLTAADIPQNISAAINWFEKAADGGQWQAHTNLAQIYAQGLAGTTDQARATFHAQRAMALGGPEVAVQLAQQAFEPPIGLKFPSAN